MTRPPSLVATLSAVTPLFLGGAEPDMRAELRPPTFKGLLRYWYRALDGDYRSLEDRFFGSTEAGQAPCLLRVDPWQEATAGWDRSRYARPNTQGGFQRGSGKQAENGILYAGYSLTLGANDRKAIFPSRRGFKVEILPRPGQDAPDTRHAWMAALWLLVHIGAVGRRARRGLGGLRVEEWSGWQECRDLPLPCQAATPDVWKDEVERGWSVLRRWFPKVPRHDDHTIVPGARLLLLMPGYDTWEQALNEAGLRLQRFRRSVPIAERVGFGLPLTGWRDPSVSRMASPLIIRVLLLGSRYYPAFVHLPAPFPPRGNSSSWPPGAKTVVQQFLDQQAVASAVEVRL